MIKIVQSTNTAEVNTLLRPTAVRETIGAMNGSAESTEQALSEPDVEIRRRFAPRHRLLASQGRGHWDTWGVQEPRVDGGWLATEFDQHRIYAPLGHPELANQFTRVVDAESALVFARQFGRLGWYELREFNEARPGLGLAEPMAADLMRRVSSPAGDGGRWVYAEPMEWVQCHARQIDWCLRAARAIGLSTRQRRDECRRLVDCVPPRIGLRAAFVALDGAVPISLRLKLRDPISVVGGLLEDLLWVNLRGVRRRVKFDGQRLQTYWGGACLLESIYTLVADAATSQAVARCLTCGRIFIRTHKAQKHCPPREGYSKSPCMNLRRVRRYRRKKRGEGRG